MSFDDIVQLERFLVAINATGSPEQAGIRVYKTREKGKKAWVKMALNAARFHGLLRVDDVPEIAQELAKKRHLNDVRVLDLDENDSDDQETFARESARFFLKKIRDIYEQVGEVHIGLGGGESVDRMVAELPTALRAHGPRMEGLCDKIWLYTLTVGHHKRDQGPSQHVDDCGDALGVDRREKLPGPQWFSAQSPAEGYRKRHAARIAETAERVNLIFTSCAVDGDFCVKAMAKSATGDLPKGFVGEVLFDLFNSQGLFENKHDAEVVSVYDSRFKLGATLPDKIRNRPAGRPFVVIGAVDETRKGSALRAAVHNTASQWFTDVICTRQVAAEVLRTPELPIVETLPGRAKVRRKT